MEAEGQGEREPGWAMGTEAARQFFGYCVLGVRQKCDDRTSCTNAAVEKAGRRVLARGRQARVLAGKIQKFLLFLK